jgi:hypothetical protein
MRERAVGGGPAHPQRNAEAGKRKAKVAESAAKAGGGLPRPNRRTVVAREIELQCNVRL